MATAYRAPIDPPEVGIEHYRDGTFQKIEDEYVARLASMARQNGTSDLLGEVVRWQVADGYASYIVWNTKPLQLVHVAVGDAYSVEDALIRGLRVPDIRKRVEGDRAWRSS